MRIDLISLFPDMLDGVIHSSILARALQHHYIQFFSHNLRLWAQNKHLKVDDRPFGGGAGMVLQPDPIARALKAIATPSATIIYTCPDGELFSTQIAREFAQSPHLIFLSGHYEGIDQRIRDQYIHREISIGDYILTNGNLAAAVIIDAVCRYVPGVLGNEISLEQDSFSDGLLTFPQYTQPRIFENISVPEVLLSGNHRLIEQWRYQQRVQKTIQRRPDLWERYQQKQ